jgi:hypothetical protein
MSGNEFMKQQYIALRSEIDDSASRMFWLLIIGMGLVMLSGYMVTENPSTLANAGLPFFLLAIMIAFINEQNNINRASKYMRDVVEPSISDVTGWEEWLSTKSHYREADRVYFISFSVLFLIFFAISASVTLAQLEKNLQLNQLYFWSTAVAYALSALCVLVVVVRHWRSSTIL